MTHILYSQRKLPLIVILQFSGRILRQYSIIELLIFFFVSSLCFLPNIGFLLPCFANLILNFVASDTFLLNLFAIALNFIELSLYL